MAYSEQEEDYMRIIETKNDFLEKQNKELKAENKKLLAENKVVKSKYCPTDSADYARLRKQARELQKKYKHAQYIIEELRAKIKELETQTKYKVNR